MKKVKEQNEVLYKRYYDFPDNIIDEKYVAVLPISATIRKVLINNFYKPYSPSNVQVSKILGDSIKKIADIFKEHYKAPIGFVSRKYNCYQNVWDHDQVNLVDRKEFDEKKQIYLIRRSNCFYKTYNIGMSLQAAKEIRAINYEKKEKTWARWLTAIGLLLTGIGLIITALSKNT